MAEQADHGRDKLEAIESSTPEQGRYPFSSHFRLGAPTPFMLYAPVYVYVTCQHFTYNTLSQSASQKCDSYNTPTKQTPKPLV